LCGERSAEVVSGSGLSWGGVWCMVCFPVVLNCWLFVRMSAKKVGFKAKGIIESIGLIRENEFVR
jgi:hypothetical protein